MPALHPHPALVLFPETAEAVLGNEQVAAIEAGAETRAALIGSPRAWLASFVPPVSSR
jgi:hypothetical protein